MSGDTLARGISMSESLDGIGNYSILDDKITLIVGRYGIRANGVTWPIIARDSVILINSSRTIVSPGISINGCYYPEVKCNVIIGDNVSDTLMKGVNVNISPGSYIQCNSVDSTGWGVYFGGVSLSTDFRGNSMSNNFEGLRLNNVAVIDTQTNKGNLWIGTFGNFGAVNMNDSSLFKLRQSFFVVDTITNNLPTTPTASPNNIGWFDQQIGTGAFECTEDTRCLTEGSDARLGELSTGASAASVF